MHKRWTRIFAVCYAVLLVLFTLYAALDTFVIPRRLTAAEHTVAAVAPETAVQTESVPRISKTAHGSGVVHAAEPVQETETNAVPAEQKASGENSTGMTGTPLSIQGTVTGTYEDARVSITITQTEAYDTDIYVADILLSSPDALCTALAYDTYGRNVKQETSAIADANDAILAINGDFYGARTEGYVIRDGVVYRDTPGRNREGLAILEDGSFLMYEEDEISAQSLVEQGARQAFSFGPALLSDGTITVSETEEVGKAMASNPRTAIGMVEDLHYVFVVSDGRTGASEGLSLYELAQVMQSIGVKDAYNLDGGGSSTMVFMGEVVNNPTTSGKKTGERAVSDIIYIGREST